MEEIKRSLNFVSEVIISKQQKLSMELMGEIKALTRQNEEKDRRIALFARCQNWNNTPE